MDAERGSPLPEHACDHDEALSLLHRVERCALESSPAEIEVAVSAISCYLQEAGGGACAGSTGLKGLGGTAVATEQTRKDCHKRVPCFRMSRSVAEAALSACRAALRLCRGEYEQLLRETAVFSCCSSSNSTPLAETLSTGDATEGDNFSAHLRAFVVGTTGDQIPARACDAPALPAAAVANGSNSLTHSAPVPSAATGDQAVAVWRAAEAMWAGAAALNIFLQENCAGPELGPDRKKALDAWFAEEVLDLGSRSGAEGRVTGGSAAGAQDVANLALACDGELPYPKSGLAGSLLTARVILAALVGLVPGAAEANVLPGEALWSANLSKGVSLAATGERTTAVGDLAGDSGTSIVTGYSPSGRRYAARGGVQQAAAFQEAADRLSSAAWWSARACVTHARLLLSSGKSETLWREAIGLFGRAVRLFGGGVELAEPVEDGGDGAVRSARERDELVRKRVAGLVWLEWGLAQHHFMV